MSIEERMRLIYRKTIGKRDVVGSPCMRSQDGQLEVQLVDRLKLRKKYYETQLDEENLWDYTLELHKT